MFQLKALILFVLLSLSIPAELFSQECMVDPRDTSVKHCISIHGPAAGRDHHIDAQDLLRMQTVSFHCSLRISDSSYTLIWVSRFRYKVSRNEKILAQGLNEGHSFLRTALGDLIYDLQPGDSVVLYDFDTNVKGMSNVELLPAGYKISRNSIFKPDDNMKAGYKMIDAIAEFDKLGSAYPGCGGSDRYTTFEWPEYNEDKTRLYFHYEFITRVEKEAPATEEIIFENVIDHDISFVYTIKSRKLTVLDHKTGKEMKVNKWTQSLPAD